MARIKHHAAVRVTYDPHADAVFIYLTEIAPGEAASSSLLDRYMKDAAVTAVFNKDDHLVGIEVLGASRVLSPEFLAAAGRP